MELAVVFLCAFSYRIVPCSQCVVVARRGWRLYSNLQYDQVCCAGAILPTFAASLQLSCPVVRVSNPVSTSPSCPRQTSLARICTSISRLISQIDRSSNAPEPSPGAQCKSATNTSCTTHRRALLFLSSSSLLSPSGSRCYACLRL